MLKVLLKFKDGIIFGLGFILILGVVNAFNTLSNVSNGETLSSSIFNDLINNQSELKTNKQNSITGTCNSGEAIKSVNTDGTVVCESLTGVAGTVVDFKYVADNTPQNLTNTIIWDDTIPQITEGNEVFSLDIAPKKVGNTLVFEGVVNWVEPTNHSDRFLAALFRNSETDAIASVSGSASGNSWCSGTVTSYHVICSFPVKFIVPADSTNNTTYSLRIGLNGGNIYFNQGTGGRRLGGTLNSFLSVTEFNN